MLAVGSVAPPAAPMAPISQPPRMPPQPVAAPAVAINTSLVPIAERSAPPAPAPLAPGLIASEPSLIGAQQGPLAGGMPISCGAGPLPPPPQPYRQLKVEDALSYLDQVKMKFEKQPHIYNKQTKKRLEKRFKDVNDPLKLVIVRDMWLTGFDAPCCHTMYVDKPMKGHNLMQAIARVNRVFKDKPGGLVVDYIGIANELKQALKTYTDAKGKGSPTHSADEAYAILLEKLDIIHGMFAPGPKGKGFSYSGFETEPHKYLVPTANYVLSLEDGKKRFLDTVLAMNKAFSLCATLDEAQELQKEVAFLSQVKTAITKFTSVDKKLTEEEKNTALKQILDNALVAEGVTDVFALCGLDKPNIGLLSDEFLEDVRQMPYKNFAVELLEKLLKDDIKAKTRNNVVQEKKYADRLQETLRKYNNRGIETAQVIEELIAMAKQFQAEMERDAALGLNPDEVAFYDALASNESAVRELGDEILKKIAVEITDKLRKSTTVDWQVRESVGAKLRILVRRTLQRYKYPPDKAPAAIELIMEQAEALSNHWTR